MAERIEALEAVKELPFAQPKRKTGWWLIREGISDAQCSECQMYFRDVYDMDNSDAFCRHCGAKMEGLKVVEIERGFIYGTTEFFSGISGTYPKA